MSISNLLKFFLLCLLVCFMYFYLNGITNSRQIYNILKRNIENFTNNTNNTNKKVKFDDTDIDITESGQKIPLTKIYNNIPKLADLENFQTKINNFIDSLNNDNLYTYDEPKQKFFKKAIARNIADIYLYAHLTVTDKYYPQHNFMENLNAQKKLLNTLHNFIYLSLTPEEEIKLKQLVHHVKQIFENINAVMSKKINSSFNNDQDGSNVNIYSGYVTNDDEPQPIDIYNDNIANLFY